MHSTLVSGRTSLGYRINGISTPTLLDLELDLVGLREELSKLVVYCSNIEISLRGLRQSESEAELLD